MKVGDSEIGAGFGYVLYSNVLLRAVVCITVFAVMVQWTKYPLGCSGSVVQPATRLSISFIWIKYAQTRDFGQSILRSRAAETEAISSCVDHRLASGLTYGLNSFVIWNLTLYLLVRFLCDIWYWSVPFIELISSACSLRTCYGTHASPTGIQTRTTSNPSTRKKQPKIIQNIKNHNPKLQTRTLDDLCEPALHTLRINMGRKDCSASGDSAMASTAYSSTLHRKTSRNGTCTHITMTRLYTDEFRCLICLKISPMGWVWRCTQDRDTMLEDEAHFEDVRASYQFH